MEAFDNTVKNYLSFLDNEYVSAGLSLFLIVYAGMAAPKLPGYIAKLFDYTLFKLFIFFLIVFVSRRNPTVAIIAAIAVMVSIMSLNMLKLGESMVVLGKHHMKNCQCECEGEESATPAVVEAPRQELRTLHEESRVRMEESNLHPVQREEVAPHAPTVQHEEVRHVEVPVKHEEIVQAVMEEKAKTEEHLGRALSQEELKQLCSGMLHGRRNEVHGHEAGVRYAAPL